MKAKLIWSDMKKGPNGFPVTENHEIEVYAEEKEIVRAEFYEAMRSGISVKKILLVRLEDFELSRHLEDEKKVYADKVEYDNEQYKIIRTYQRGKSKVELTCGGV